MPVPRNPNAFANSPLDRAGHRRRDAAWLAEALAGEPAKLIALKAGRPLVCEEGDALGVRWLAGAAHGALGKPGAPLIFLGVDAEGAPHFACEIGDAAQVEGVGRFDDLRAAATRLPADELAMIGCAKALLEWHATHGFCAKCGGRSESADAGWKRVCTACKAEHFPRVDPVVIMLPVFGEKCLLGRQARWPRGMHSALAGYVEPGETIEEAVARETLEESGLVVEAVRLHSTQPWPFPSSLMIGAICEVAHDRATIDAEELESARWFTRDEARLMLEAKHPDCWCPPPYAIAHQLLRSWVGRCEVAGGRCQS